jgi:hypothetical protein
MSAWLWVNLSLGALFVMAIVGIPLWMVLKRPDTGTASAPAIQPAHALAREATAHVWRTARWQAAAATLAGSRREAERSAQASAERTTARRDHARA